MATKKKAPEYFQGFDYGFAAADENITKYGRVFAEVHGLRSLEASARKRDATPWDKGYAAGYRARYESGR
jgi:hypothetical protein